MGGGAWNNEARNLRAANRNRNDPGNRNDNIGFRCARDVGRVRLCRHSNARAGSIKVEPMSAGMMRFFRPNWDRSSEVMFKSSLFYDIRFVGRERACLKRSHLLSN